jgi:hypothetical protein
VLPWVQDRIVEIDEEKWAPYASEITILEGPAIPIDRLSMGRGWSTAQREGTDVTERVLAEARQAMGDGSAGEPEPNSPEPASPAPAQAPTDYPSLAGSSADGASEQPAPPPELDGLLGAEPAQLLAAWRAVGSRTAGLAPSEALALAERELGRGDAAQP